MIDRKVVSVIETENKMENKITSDQIARQYQIDKNTVENFLNRKTATLDFSAYKRLVLSELVYKNSFHHGRFCGFSKRQIKLMSESPERYGSHIIQLSRFMISKSGYYKRLIDYFVNMGVVNWTVDTEVKTVQFFNQRAKTLKANYIKYVAQCNKFKLDINITRILRRMFVDDVCFGFMSESDIDTSLFFIEPKYCEIKKCVAGNVFEYAVNRSLMNDHYIETLPLELQEIINASYETQKNNMVMIPYENSLCLKYNDDFTYPYPPFFFLVNGILDIDDYKDIAKAKTEADAYKLIYLAIPTENGEIAMNEDIVTAFTEMTKKIVPETFGVVPSPLPVSLIESTSTSDDDSDNVSSSVSNYYSEAGISQAITSEADSSAELNIAIRMDSSDIYRIYRQLEAWVDLQMKLRGHIYRSYDFVFKIYPMTVYDKDAVDAELKLAQASAPNKGRLMASAGMNIAKTIGNTVMENDVLSDVFGSWIPLATSYTQSGDSNSTNADTTDEGGRPAEDDTEITEGTEVQRDNGSNDTENRSW